MARLDKLKRDFKQCRGTFKYGDFKKLIEGIGYVPVLLSGSTGGSRRRYHNATNGHIVTLDEPHDGEMKFGMVKRLRDDLLGRGSL